MAEDGPSAAMRVFAQLDLVIIAAALPLFLLADLPIIGYVVASIAWLIQRFVRAAAEQRISQGGEARTIALLTAGSLVGPIWFMTMTVLIVGIAVSRPDGLAAALLTLALFTVSLPVRMLKKKAGA
ncbi:MAG: hypothetical protein QOG62_2036 [Thermoleophilaceae bacterium]|jgi:hypothetical protein|nr:hypothetical protein [Thermoleophilaceae bacterium]